MKKFILILILFVVVSVIGLAAFTGHTLLAPKDPTITEKRVINVEKGSSPKKVARDLQTLGLIRNAEVFYWYGKVTGKWAQLKAGEYDLSPSQTADEIFRKLESGLGLQRVLLVKEGLNLYEIGDIVAAEKIATKQAFVSLVTDPTFIASLHLPGLTPKTLEGLLYPDTYYFTRTTTLEELVRGMVKRFTAAYSETIVPVLAKTNLSPYQMITLASMVEKETGAPQERPMIAAVFYNRLKKGMKLQSDPTTIYGMWSRYKGNIRKSDLLEPSPYNTYTIPALPVGPICNPGRDAMLAVVQPATHEFLYFVSKNDGTHLFSKSYEDHLKAVNAFQVNAAAREGKSWRDLSKTKKN